MRCNYVPSTVTTAYGRNVQTFHTNAVWRGMRQVTLRIVGVHGVSATLNGVMCKKTRILTNSHVKHSKLTVGSKTVSILVQKHCKVSPSDKHRCHKDLWSISAVLLLIYCKLICIHKRLNKTSVTKQNILLRTEYNSKWITINVHSANGEQKQKRHAQSTLCKIQKAKQANLWVELVKNTRNSRQLVAFSSAEVPTLSYTSKCHPH